MYKRLINQTFVAAPRPILTYVTTTELNSNYELLSPDEVNREILATLRMIREHLEEK